MKNDNKVFPIYILIILIYGLSYWFTSGKSFAFSPAYSDFGLGLISLGFFFHKSMNKYSILLVTLGFSFFYLFANIEEFSLIDESGFFTVKNLSLLVFALFLLYDLSKSKLNQYRWALFPLAIILIGFFVLRVFEVEFSFTRVFSFVKNCFGFLLVLTTLKISSSSEKQLPTNLKRVIIVVGLSFLIEMLTFLTR